MFAKLEATLVADKQN